MDLLKELIRIDSSTRENANRAVEYAAEYLNRNGITGKILERNGFRSYVAVIGKGERTLVFNGHLDVVSGKDSQFEPAEKDGKIYGRGSADMKGGCAAMIGAMIRLKDEKLSCRVMLQLVPDEETGGANGTAYLVEQGYLGDFVVCTEPTNLKVSIQSKGIIRMDIDTYGVSAHGSRPWEGENAILKAMKNYSIISCLPIMNEGSEFYEKSSLNLAIIESGDIYNRVPDKCTIGLDIRYVPRIDPEKIIEDIRKAIDGDVHIKIVEHGVNVDPGHPSVRLLRKTVEKIVPDGNTELAAQHGGSDTRYFTAKGIPAVEFGPRGNYWHGESEYVETESIKQLERILTDFALNF